MKKNPTRWVIGTRFNLGYRHTIILQAASLGVWKPDTKQTLAVGGVLPKDGLTLVGETGPERYVLRKS